MVLGSLLRLQQLVDHALEQMLRPFGLTPSGHLLLATIQLSSHGRRLLSHIASAMLVRQTTVTLTVERLEARGTAAT